MALPDFFLIGAPKAGTTALHAALAQHPELYLSTVKEPKFYLCNGRPPPRATQRGPGDAHSAREWVWRREKYEALFDAAPAGRLTGESTPFYLYDRAAHRRIHADVPDAKLLGPRPDRPATRDRAEVADVVPVGHGFRQANDVRSSRKARSRGASTPTCRTPSCS